MCVRVYVGSSVCVCCDLTDQSKPAPNPEIADPISTACRYRKWCVEISNGIVIERCAVNNTVSMLISPARVLGTGGGDGDGDGSSVGKKGDHDEGRKQTGKRGEARRHRHRHP